MKIDPVAHRGRFIFAELSLARDSLSSRVQDDPPKCESRGFVIALDATRSYRLFGTSRAFQRRQGRFCQGNVNGNRSVFPAVHPATCLCTRIIIAANNASATPLPMACISMHERDRLALRSPPRDVVCRTKC